ncbi:hypothetical protein [Shinella sp.]|uniref:hypothetical protein n=1 Tax=Shinella sp. TaxID=1870904 RepID=UPI003F714DD0
MSGSSFTYQYFQLDAGSDEMRVFNSRPGFSGKLAFIPNAPTFYLTAIDTEGYEHLIEIFADRDAALAAADGNWQAYGVKGLHDQTMPGMPHVYKSYASPDGWAYIRLEGGTDVPRPSKVNWEAMEALIPDGACWYVIAVSTGGEEWPAFVGCNEADARQFAGEALAIYGVSDLIDLTRMGSA